MASEFAMQLTQAGLGADLIQDALDKELAEVREVLDGLLVRQWSGNVPILCWCESIGDDEHSDACQRTQSLYSKLRIDK